MAAISTSQLRALLNDRNLRRFVVQARPTGRHLGTGSYGTVEEVCGGVHIQYHLRIHASSVSRPSIGQSEKFTVRWKEDS